ncbi:MAG: type II toxin-antitoxin system VapB family antitoxin [Caulobacterales bacterium]
MGIFIKNPEVERKARELARLRRTSLTEAVGAAVQSALTVEQAKQRPRPTLEEMRAATVEFRRKAGLDKVKLNVTKADFDALWAIPGFEDEGRDP